MEHKLEPIRLTQFSHGAGCGCKISPAILDQILKSSDNNQFPGLLVGYEGRDDAAVFDLGDETALISTTDFFMPIVDDPYDFGRIASVNAISDVYAMGGKPLLAIGILGWPIDKIDPYWAGQVLEGARAICKEAGIPLAGGHSIDCPEPVFGLAVNGRVRIDHLKKNDGAKAGDLIYLSKGLGVGILTTAEKQSILEEKHKKIASDSMLRLNRLGEEISKYQEVHALTDITGFGFCGHLNEMCKASSLLAKINYVKLPVLDPVVYDYIKKGAIPGGTKRNWNSYGAQVQLDNPEWYKLLGDPQTSGGLLISIDPAFKKDFETILQKGNWYAECIGEFSEKSSEERLNILVE